MADTRPIVFVASSARQEPVVQALAAQLEPFAIPDPWVDGQAELGKSVLQWALSKVDGCSYGIFVFAPDERWGGQINGNVLLELGLFIARHGAERCFILRESTVEVPADLRGIITAAAFYGCASLCDFARRIFLYGGELLGRLLLVVIEFALGFGGSRDVPDGLFLE